MDPKELPPNVRDDKISEETKKLISSLPSHTDSQGQKLCKYQGCWYYYNTLQGVLNFQSGFQPQDTDIILASYPKSGTTWLKALTVALLGRSKNHSSSNDHPLLSSPNLDNFSATPRLFSTHMPLHAMQETLKQSPCKIVYVCRNLKDTILDSMFKSLCNGTIFYGPFWDHLLSYWRGSFKDPKHVLFMRYEEMKAEPHEQIKRHADFLGCPFTKQEEESGVFGG
ncbi:BnaC04g20070D [Brassica napus]|uniref:Sulfotransferase n=1 Tax=Brassica napus TaxID=3708 RepID=A0A078HAF1_BRANA|nr:BnaC04g20070D [Brassica napus]